MKSKTYAKKIVIVGLMIALNIILVRFLSIQTPIIRISFGFLPLAIVAILYGPIWAGAAGAIGDVVGITLVPIGTPFFGFTVTAFLTGAFYGLVLHNRAISYKNVLLAALPVSLICQLLLDTYWLHLLMGKAVMALLPMRLVKVGIMLPVQVIVIYLVWHKIISKTGNRQSITTDDSASGK